MGNDYYRRDSYDLERFIQNHKLIPALTLLMKRHGTRCSVHRNVRSTQQEPTPIDSSYARDVYGNFSGFTEATPLDPIFNAENALTPSETDAAAFEAKVLIPNYVFAAADQTYANDFEEYFIWTFDDIRVGDVISTAKFNPNRVTTLRAIEAQSWGNADKVAARLKVAHASF